MLQGSASHRDLIDTETGHRHKNLEPLCDSQIIKTQHLAKRDEGEYISNTVKEQQILVHADVSEWVVNYCSGYVSRSPTTPVAPMSQGNMSCCLSGASGIGGSAQVHTITHTHPEMSPRVHSVSDFQSLQKPPCVPASLEKLAFIKLSLTIPLAYTHTHTHHNTNSDTCTYADKCMSENGKEECATVMFHF